MLAYGFNLALSFVGAGFSVLRQVDFSVTREFCEAHKLQTLEVYALFKEMVMGME